MILGPVNVTNAWQGDEGEDGNPTPEWYKRRDEVFANPTGVRHTKPGRKYLYNFGDGKKMDKAAGRKKILLKYCKELSENLPEYTD